MKGPFILCVSNFKDLDKAYADAREEAKSAVDSSESHKDAVFVITSFNEIPSE